MVFDYQYIDPGPDDPSSRGHRYFALNVSHTVTMFLSIIILNINMIILIVYISLSGFFVSVLQLLY